MTQNNKAGSGVPYFTAHREAIFRRVSDLHIENYERVRPMVSMKCNCHGEKKAALDRCGNVE